MPWCITNRPSEGEIHYCHGWFLGLRILYERDQFDAKIFWIRACNHISKGYPSFEGIMMMIASSSPRRDMLFFLMSIMSMLTRNRAFVSVDHIIRDTFTLAVQETEMSAWTNGMVLVDMWLQWYVQGYRAMWKVKVDQREGNGVRGMEEVSRTGKCRNSRSNSLWMLDEKTRICQNLRGYDWRKKNIW
jgi:hypothetical protein